MELNKFHVLHWQAGAQHHGAAVTRAGMSGSTREIRTAVAARSENDLVRAKTMQATRCQVDRDDTPACAIFHYQINGKILNEKLGIVFEGLLIQRMQHRVACAISCRTGALCSAFAKVGRHAPKRALVYLAILRTGKRHTVVLQLDDGCGRFLAHVLDRILVAEPVGALDGVVHVPAPVVLTHVAQRCADAALRRNGVTASRKYLGEASGLEARLGQTKGCSQACTAGTYDHDIVAVIDEFVVAHAPGPVCNIETIATTPITACAKRERLCETGLMRVPCT